MRKCQTFLIRARQSLLDTPDRAVGQYLFVIETLTNVMATVVETLGLITTTLVNLFLALINVKAPVFAANWPTPSKPIRTK